MNEVEPEILVFGPEIWSEQSNGGISRYFAELSNNVSLLGSSCMVLIPPNSNSHAANINTQLDLRNLKQALKSISKSSYSKKKIYHATYYNKKNLRIAKSLGFKTIITVFDMISEIFPDKPPRFRFFPNIKRKSIRLADGIICISESTKNDLIRIYGIDESAIQVIYLASSFQVRAPTDLQKRRENFILYVGNRSGYKNFKILLNAFGDSHFLKSNFTLIAFGGGQFNEEEEEEIAKLNVGKSVIHIGGDDSRLKELYLTSKLLVYPSLYEGFGLPLLEAMSLGCPVIASEVSSMPEIGHEAVLYFDPSSAEGLQSLLEKTLLDEELLETLTQKGLARSAKFSWQETARETLDFYNKL